jgi:hypothetical protein
MFTWRLFVLLIALLCVAACFGCSKNYVIIQPLEEPFELGKSCVIGEIEDQLPLDTELEDRPTAEHIQKLKGYIVSELTKRVALAFHFNGGSEPRYLIRGAVLDFKKGSGALRFFIGLGAGSAKFTCNLELVDTQSDAVLFSGNFSESVSSYTESGDKTMERIAKNFAKALEKELKRLGAVS